MKDLTLICQNCNSEFVFSVGEQQFYADKNLTTPKFCPICRAIKTSEKLRPPRPAKL